MKPPRSDDHRRDGRGQDRRVDRDEPDAQHHRQQDRAPLAAQPDLGAADRGAEELLTWRQPTPARRHSPAGFVPARDDAHRTEQYRRNNGEVRHALQVTHRGSGQGVRRHRHQHGVVRDRSRATSRRPACWASPYAATTSPRAPTPGCPAFKVFHSLVPNPTPGHRVSTHDQPVQSFSWDDFTCQPGQPLPLRLPSAQGHAEEPRPLGDRADASTIRTEPLYGDAPRRVLQPRRREQPGLRARVRQQPRSTTSTPTGRSRRSAGSAATSTTRCCASSTRPCPVTRCSAASTSSPTQPVAHGPEERDRPRRRRASSSSTPRSTSTATARRIHASFPREENLATIADARHPDRRIILREARTSATSRTTSSWCCSRRGAVPTEVWTGSTNLSAGGIHGQTNVGHWVRDPATAARFQGYWNLLDADPGGRAGRHRSDVIARTRRSADAVEQLSPVPTDLRDVAGRGHAGLQPASDDRACSTVRGPARHRDTRGLHHPRLRRQRGFKDLLKDNTADRTRSSSCCSRSRTSPTRSDQDARSCGSTPATTSTRRGARSSTTRSTSGRRRPTPRCSASTSTSATSTRSSC